MGPEQHEFFADKIDLLLWEGAVKLEETDEMIRIGDQRVSSQDILACRRLLEGVGWPISYDGNDWAVSRVGPR